MKHAGPDEIAKLLDGHVDARRRGDALQPLRYPAAEHGYYDPFTRWVATCTAGVRLRFRTDSRSVVLRGAQRLLARPTSDERRGAYDLWVDGRPVDRRWAEGGADMEPDSGALTGDEAFSVTFEGLPAGDKVVELWLPQAATVSLTDLALDDGASLEPAGDPRPRLLFHGSSITHGMEAEGAAAAWPAIASAEAGASHQNLGWAGSCLLSGLAARIVRDARADAVILKLGINVWPQGMLKARTFTDSAHAMISIVRERHRTTPLAIVSPIASPPREATGDQGGPSLREMRSLLAEVVRVRQAAGDAAIRYVDGLALFGEADAHLLPDDLHPNTEGQRLMGQRFFKLALEGAGGMLAQAKAAA